MILPGSGYSGYVSLKEIIEKQILRSGSIIFEINNNLIYANKKQLQGIKINENNAVINGVHYTAWESATQIRSLKRIEPSLNDPFIYISEPGKMSAWPEETIKKELGSQYANTEVKITINVPVERVWVKSSRFVAHYAVSGILSKEIIKLNIEKRKL